MAKKTAAPAAPEGTSLASIEAGADEELPRDPGAAVGQLSAFPADAGSAPADAAPARRTRRPRALGAEAPPRGRPRRESREELIARAEAAESRLAALGSMDSPEYKQGVADLGGAIGGAVDMLTGMYVAGKPEREGWQWSEAETKRWGELWAPVLYPHMPALGAMAPWMMAALGTSQLVMAKARTAREVAAKVKKTPEALPAVTDEKQA